MTNEIRKEVNINLKWLVFNERRYENIIIEMAQTTKNLNDIILAARFINIYVLCAPCMRIDKT